MEEHEGQSDLRSVEPGPRLVKLASSLNLEHEVAAVDVLHDKEKAVFGLEARVQSREEGVLGRQRQDRLLRHGAVHVIILDDHFLLQDFDGVHLVRSFALGQHHLPGETA